jgi:plasmid maintenance system antidote protein VapI
MSDQRSSKTPARTNLGDMLRCFMAMERWSMRKLAPEIGISSATLHRVCAGYAMDGDTLLKVINWMMQVRR